MGQLLGTHPSTGSQAAPHERPLPPSNTPSCKPFSVLQPKPPSHQTEELVPEPTAHSHCFTIAVCAVLSCYSCVRLFATPGAVVHKAPLSMGLLQAGILDWVALSSSRGPSWPRDWTQVSCGACIACRFFTTEPPGKPVFCCLCLCLSPEVGVTGSCLRGQQGRSGPWHGVSGDGRAGGPAEQHASWGHFEASQVTCLSGRLITQLNTFRCCSYFYDLYQHWAFRNLKCKVFFLYFYTKAKYLLALP